MLWEIEFEFEFEFEFSVIMLFVWVSDWLNFAFAQFNLILQCIMLELIDNYELNVADEMRVTMEIIEEGSNRRVVLFQSISFFLFKVLSVWMQYFPFFIYWEN